MEPTLGLPGEWKRIGECIFELGAGTHPGQQVPLRIVADEALLERWRSGRQLAQLLELTTLPRVGPFVLGLPNLNEGDDTVSGAVVATQSPDGVVVPSMIGPDINCGLRLLSSPMLEKELIPRIAPLLDALTEHLAVGVERGGPLQLSDRELDELLKEGERYLVRERGIGTDEDLQSTESWGHFHEAHGEHLSRTAKSYGRQELGTLGSGRSHFVEIGVVDEVYDVAAMERFGLDATGITVLLHTGARRLGAQTYAETVETCRQIMEQRHLRRYPSGLAYAPLDATVHEGKGPSCYHALRAAANYGWANRHVLTHQTRVAFEQVFGVQGADFLSVVCDSAADFVNLERFNDEIYCVHRRAAASAYGASTHLQHSPAHYDLGEPLIVPGSMGSSSFVLIGTDLSSDLSLASASHGAGRVLSRRAARKLLAPHEMREHMSQKGVWLRSPDMPELREEIPEAYRDAETVVSILERAGIARRVARLRPRAVIKG